MLDFIQSLELSIGIYFIVVLVWSYLLIISATRQIWADRQQEVPTLKKWPTVSILIPMYNEEVVIIDTLDHIFNNMKYPGRLEVCICDDGSTDSSFDLVKQIYDLSPVDHKKDYWKSNTHSLKVIHKENGGRASALNEALRCSNGKYIVSTDADTVIDPEGFRKIIAMMESDSELESVGGSILISNNKEIRQGKEKNVVGMNPLIGTQTVEYIRSFIYGRMGLNNWGGNLIVSGAFGVFRRKTVKNLGGWSTEALAEDLDMTVKIREANGKVLFIPDPVAWTEAPSTIKSLGNQRDRWYRGLTQGLWKWKNRIFTRTPTKGLSHITLPYYWIVEWLSPIVQLLGLVVITINIIWYSFNWPFVLYLLGVAYVLVVGLSIWSLILEQTYYKRYATTKDSLKLFGFALIEPFWYGPIHVYWRLRGLIKYLLFRDRRWGTMKRTGSKIASLVVFMLLPGGISGQELNWVESTLYSEQPQINRTELISTVNFSITTLSIRQAWYNQRYDDQVRVGVWYDHNKKFGIHGSMAASIQNTTIVPNHEQDWNIYGVVGPLVLQTGVTWRWYNTDNKDYLVQYNQRIEYYVNDNMVDLTISNVPSESIGWARMGVRQWEEDFSYSIFGIVGDQLLDFALTEDGIPFIGPTRIAGTQFYIPRGSWEFRPGFLMGERNDTFYTGLTLGVRYNFN